MNIYQQQDTLTPKSGTNEKRIHVRIANRLGYSFYDYALYYNGNKPRTRAILDFDYFNDICKLADKIVIPGYHLFDVYLALILIYYESTIQQDSRIKNKQDTLARFHNERKTRLVPIAFLLDELDDNSPRFYLRENYRSSDDAIAFIKQECPDAIQRLHEIGYLKVGITSFVSSVRFGGRRKIKTRKKHRKKN